MFTLCTEENKESIFINAIFDDFNEKQINKIKRNYVSVIKKIEKMTCRMLIYMVFVNIIKFAINGIILLVAAAIQYINEDVEPYRSIGGWIPIIVPVIDAFLTYIQGIFKFSQKRHIGEQTLLKLRCESIKFLNRQSPAEKKYNQFINQKDLLVNTFILKINKILYYSVVVEVTQDKNEITTASKQFLDIEVSELIEFESSSFKPKTIDYL